MAPSKFSFFILSFVFVLACHFKVNAGISLEEALKNKWVTATIRGFDYRKDSVYRSSFYGSCLVLTCKNLRTTPIEITEAAGRFFLPDDTTIQRMVLTDAVTFTLAAQQERSMPMYAMCTEAHDGAPGFDSKFKAGKMACPELLPLINFIAAHHYQNEAAQQAIWCITDKYSPYSISSEDTLISNQFRKYVCGLTNVKFEKDRVEEKAAPMFRMVDGTFTYIIQKSKKVDLIIYNEAGQEIKKLVSDETQPAGTYNYNYHFNLPINENALLRQALIIKFYLNGEMIAEKKHVLESR
ncbi:MAG: hypothetical protein ABI729_10345 [Chitinophagales bacterium]